MSGDSTFTTIYNIWYQVYVLVWNAQPYGHVFPCLTCFLTSLLSMTCMQVMVGLSDEVFDSIAAR